MYKRQAQETFLSDETLTPNPNQDFSQVDPARLYEEYVRVKAAIAVPAANWMKSGNNDAPFSNFCNDRLIAYIFHIFKESAKLGPDGRFTEILPGWFQALGGLAPDIGATASGARRSVVGAAGLARADLLVQRGVSPLKRGGCTARKAARSLPSDGGAEGVDAAALVIADAIRFSSAPPETTLSYLKVCLQLVLAARARRALLTASRLRHAPSRALFAAPARIVPGFVVGRAGNTRMCGDDREEHGPAHASAVRPSAGQGRRGDDIAPADADTRCRWAGDHCKLAGAPPRSARTLERPRPRWALAFALALRLALSVPALALALALVAPFTHAGWSAAAGDGDATGFARA